MKTFAYTLGMLSLLLTFSSFKTADQNSPKNSLKPPILQSFLTTNLRSTAEIDPPPAPPPSPKP